MESVLSTKYLESTYEKMYLYEEDTKDKISLKTQVIFTAIFALVSITSYLARFLDFSEKPEIANTIGFLVGLVVFISAISAYFNCRAFSGSEFRRMPYSTQVKKYFDEQVEYNAEIIQYNDQVAERDRLPLIDPANETEKFIYNTYAECATHNAMLNEQRSRWAFKATAVFLIACIPLAIASFLFVVFDMDTSSPRKNLAIKDSYVGGEIASLKIKLSSSDKSDIVENLEKRTMLIEQMLTEKKEAVKLSNSQNNTTTSEKKSPPPTAPVKPSAPPSRVMYDDINGGPNRNQK